MAENRGKKAGWVIASILLLLISTTMFLAMIGLGAWGIVRAQDVNPCAARNLTGVAGCQPAANLIVRGDAGGSFQAMDEWIYWLVGSTVAGLLWAVVQALAGKVLIATIVVFEADKDSVVQSDNMEMRATGGQAGRDQTDSDRTEQLTFTIGGTVPRDTDTDKPKAVRELTPGAAVGLFFSLLSFACAVMCLLWGIATSYNHTRRDDSPVYAYIGVEVLTAIIMPLFLFACVILMGIVLDFITQGGVDLRTLIPKYLPALKFQSGTAKELNEAGDGFKDEPCDFWSIEETFYFKVPKHKHEKNSFKESFDGVWSTWFLIAIVCLGIHLVIAHFVDYTLDTQTTLLSPDGCDTVDSTYRCFEAGTLDPTDCMDHNGTVHCFKFLRFGVDVDLFASAAIAFGLHIATNAAFVGLFTALNIVMHIKTSKWWGLLFVAVGGLGIVGGIVLTGVWIWGYVLPQIEEILHFNIINIAQVFIISMYILMVGLLVIKGEWWKYIPLDDDKKKVKTLLARPKDGASVPYDELEKGALAAHEASGKAETSV